MTLFSLPFSQQQLERALSPLGQPTAFQVREVFAGNINVILKIESGDHTYGVRVRVHESVYRYEPDLTKEVFILLRESMKNYSLVCFLCWIKGKELWRKL